jgi:class III poly(R)-hydroxyalkanoic acid synthase PhaE subunit
MDALVDQVDQEDPMTQGDWSEQARAMSAAWLDAQKALWDSWAQMARGPQAQPRGFADAADEWQKMAAQSMQAWSAATDPVARSTAEQFLAAQRVMLNFVDFAGQAWEETARGMQSGQDWQAGMTQAVEQLRRRWTQAPADLAATTQDVNALWQLYLDQWRAFGQPWEAVWRSAPGQLGLAASGDRAALVELTDAYRETYQQTFGRLASSPNLGMTRELVAKLQEGFDAFVAWNLANVEYQAVMGEVWDAAFKQFGTDLTELAKQEKKIDNVRDLTLLWTRGAERVFTEAFRGERYTLAQGKLLNATMRYRTCQRQIVEQLLKQVDLPTRTELDETHRRIYELRKEVKALRKRLDNLEAPAAAPAAPARGKTRKQGG